MCGGAHLVRNMCPNPRSFGSLQAAAHLQWPIVSLGFSGKISLAYCLLFTDQPTGSGFWIKINIWKITRLLFWTFLELNYP